jgi:hypothetical protein
MKILSTADIPLIRLKEAAFTLPEDWDIEIENAQSQFRSMDVPSWVSIVAESPWYVQLFAASVSVYFSGILSEAGKDTWKNRGVVVDAIKRAPTAISKLAKFIISAGALGSDKTFVTLAIPFLDEYNTIRLKLDFVSQEELEVLIAAFVHHLPALQALLESKELLDDDPVGGMQLELGDDYSMLVTWMDRKDLQINENVLPFDATQYIDKGKTQMTKPSAN